MHGGRREALRRRAASPATPAASSGATLARVPARTVHCRVAIATERQTAAVWAGADAMRGGHEARLRRRRARPVRREDAVPSRRFAASSVSACAVHCAVAVVLPERPGAIAAMQPSCCSAAGALAPTLKPAAVRHGWRTSAPRPSSDAAPAVYLGGSSDASASSHLVHVGFSSRGTRQLDVRSHA
jgi:hypothetical protein